MFTIKKTIAGILICFSLLSTTAYSKQFAQSGKHHGTSQKETIRCESKKNKRKHCDANTRNGVKLINELSRNKCQGNWGHDGKGVWVKDGCKAKFQVSRSGHDNNRPNHNNNRPAQVGQTIKCQSIKYRKKYCDIPNLKSVRLIEVLSKHTPCNDKWGYDERGIWVNNNCKAVFSYTTGRGSNYGGNNYYGGSNNYGNNHSNNHGGNNNHGSLGPSRTLKCKSRSRGKKICAQNVRKANLTREISKGKYPCKNNWGIDRHGDLYVKNNCYAEFKYWD